MDSEDRKKRGDIKGEARNEIIGEFSSVTAESNKRPKQILLLYPPAKGFQGMGLMECLL